MKKKKTVPKAENIEKTVEKNLTTIDMQYFGTARPYKNVENVLRKVLFGLRKVYAT